MSESKKSLFSRPQTPSGSVIGTDIEQFVRGSEVPSGPLQPVENLTTKSVEPIQEKRKEEPLKRLTIDIPLGLHKRVKAGCAAQETTIADLVREILEKKFPPPKRQES